MYSSNDRYYAAKMAAERREMMERSTRTSRNYSNQFQPQVLVAVAPAPTLFDAVRASLTPLNIITSIFIISLIILVLVLIPLGL